MTRRVTLILVTYFSAREAARAIAAFRGEAAGSGFESEVVVVDHSESPEEAEALEALEPDVLWPRPNRGYAAGLNSGIEAAEGDILLLSNPDVSLDPGALPELVGALDAGWDVVGPLFHLGPWLYPPADRQTPAAELGRWLGTLAPWSAARHRRRELRRFERLWTATGPLETAALSGAMVATKRTVLERVGPWDEGYFLYFEETDWLRRAAARGCRIAQLPGARARHSWAHAAKPEEQGGRHAAARRRYYARHFGVLGRWVASLEEGAAAEPPPLPPPEELPPGAEWLLSPSPRGVPAALGVGVGRGGLLDAVGEFRRHSGATGPVFLTARLRDSGGAEIVGPFRVK